MDLLQEYKELYYKEIEFKESMSNKIGTSITFLTILCTGHMLMWDIMVDLDFIISPLPLLFLLLEIISIYYTGLSMYNFYKAYYKYNYHLIAISEIQKRLDENNSLKKYYSEQEIEKANYDMLCKTFYTYTVINRQENIRKNKRQIRLSSSLVKAIASLILTYTMWVFIISQFTF